MKSMRILGLLLTVAAFAMATVSCATPRNDYSPSGAPTARSSLSGAPAAQPLHTGAASTPTAAGTLLELVIFEVKDGVGLEALRAAARKSQTFVMRQPGFLKRALYHAPRENRWVDLVWWRDRASAEKADQLSQHSSECADLLSAIPENKLQMMYLMEVKLQRSFPPKSVSTVVELSVFGVRDGLSATALQAAAQRSQTFVERQPGYLGRELYHSEKELRWVDVVYWADRPSAESADQLSMKSPECSEFLSSIPADKLQMFYLTEVSLDP